MDRSNENQSNVNKDYGLNVNKDLQITTNRSNIISVATLLLVGYLVWFVMWNEVNKVWGWDNFNKAKTLYALSGYKNAQNTSLDQAISSLNGNAPTPAPAATGTVQPAQPAPQQEQFPTAKLTADKVSEMKKWFAVEGDANAQVTIIEYTDPECPFCVRHHNDKTIATTISNFTGKVNHIIKVVQWVNHPWTEKKSIAVICAGKIGGDKNYIAMFDKIMSASTTSSMVSVDKIPELAKELWLDDAKFAACLTSPESKDIYTKNRAEAQSVWANGTPGNLIINNTTFETKLVAGAYPADQFKTIITSMIK